MKNNVKKLLPILLTSIMLGTIGTTVFANDSVVKLTVTPQEVTEVNTYEENGAITCEYVWKDGESVAVRLRATSEDTQMGYATWMLSTQNSGTLKHRAAKISPKYTTSAWYACAQTDYSAWHFSRARIIKTLGGKILEDSNQVQVSSGRATARTPKDSLYLLDIDFSLRSFWGV